MRTALWSLLLIAGVVAAQVARPTSDEAAKLVEKLGSSVFREREEATKKLTEMGEAALPALREAVAGGDLETRLRASRLINEIEQKLDSDRLLAPTKVRLDVKDASVKEAVEALAKKSGQPIKLEADAAKVAGRRITLDTGEVPFWSALDQLCEKAGLVERGSVREEKPVGNRGSTVIMGGNPRVQPRDILKPEKAAEPVPVVLTDGTPKAAPTDVRGAARLRVLPPGTQIEGVEKASGEALFALEAKVEPRHRLKGTVGVRVEKAVDDQGQTLEPVTAPLRKEKKPARGGSITINGVRIDPPDEDDDAIGPVPVRLTLGEKRAKSLKELRGTLIARIESAPEPLVTIDKILEAKDKREAGARGGSVKVLEVAKQDGGAVKLKLLVEAPGSPQEEGPPLPINATIIINGKQISPRVDTVSGRSFSLVDDKGKAFKLVKAVATGQRVGPAPEVELTFEPEEGQGAAARLVYTAPRTATVEIPFVLKDVPLP